MYLEQDATLLKCEEFPYDFEGRKGIAYSARILVAGTLFKCKISKEVFDALKDQIEVKGTAKLSLTSNKEKITLSLTDFEV